MNESKKYYAKDSVAQGYDKERFSSKAGQMFDLLEKKIVLSNAPKNKDALVLDAGAGTGRFTIELAKEGYNIVSCDQSNAMVEIIEEKIHRMNLNNVEVSIQDITNLSFKNDNFDYIDCMRVFVNLDTKENISSALNELIRVCKPGGTIVFDIVNPKSLARFGPLKESMITLKEMKRLITFYDEIEIRNIFGSRILSQNSFEKTPEKFLLILDKLDKFLSDHLTSYSVRIYFVLKKND